MSRALCRLLLLVGAASASGCFLGLDETALHQGADAIAPADAGAGIDASTTIDAALDAAATAHDSAIADATATPPDLPAARDAIAPPVDGSAPGDLALPPCTAQLCDDFEGAAFASWWNRYTMNATVGLDGTRAYRGTQSFHVALAAQPANSQAVGLIGEGQSWSGLQADFYARVFLWVPSPAPTQAVVVESVFENVTPYDGSDLVVDAGKLEIDNHVAGTMHLSTTALPLDRWVCVEWHVHQAASGGYDLWLDGQPVADLAITGESTQPAASPFSAFHLKQSIVFSSTPIPALDLWADSLVIDSQRVGCAK